MRGAAGVMGWEGRTCARWSAKGVGRRPVCGMHVGHSVPVVDPADGSRVLTAWARAHLQLLHGGGNDRADALGCLG